MKKIGLIGLLRQHAARIGLSLIVVLTLLLHSAGVINLGFVQRLENYTYDLRLLWTMPAGVDKRVVIVDIDESSLQQLGQWPWPRNRLAQMIDLLFDKYHIDVLGFDIVFAEPDGSSGLASLEQLAQTGLKDDKDFGIALQKLRPSLMYDELLAQSLKNRRVVLGYYFRQDAKKDRPVGKLPAPMFPAGSFPAKGVASLTATGYTANLPELQQAAAAGGFFDTQLIDADGVFRRVPLLQKYGGALYETLSLAMARLALRNPPVALGYVDGDTSAVALESLKLGARRIPADAEVGALIPYRGREGSFPYVSAADVLQGKVAPDVLRDAIVLVGTTAPGLKDLRSMPMQEVYPGVEAHANMIAGIIDGTINSRPAYTLGLEVVQLLVVGLFLALTLAVLSPLRATLVSIIVALALIAFNLYFWNTHHMVLAMASGLLLTATLFILNMSYGFFVDSRGKRLLAGLFGQYVPPELVDEMAQDPGAYVLTGLSREMTVLFADVRGFTSISEGLSPQQLTQLMNEYLTPMTKVIHSHRGTIDKYIGDAIMAFWGAPVEDAEHARHAMLAALDMVKDLRLLDAPFKAKGWPPIRIGVGLNTGEMTVGNMGSEFRLAYTVMGDTVNLASRLESLTRLYGVEIIVSEFTRTAVPEVVYRELDRVRVKGKDIPVVIYEPLGLAADVSAADQQELSRYKVALKHYREQNWRLAADAFDLLQVQSPERTLYRIYSERIVHLVQNPPGADWDGSYTFTTK